MVRPEEPLHFRCDRERLVRALFHVIENATRFAPEGSVVALAVADEGDHVRFSVTDRGPGLSDEMKAHLYERAWHAKRPGRAGAGLGLAVVHGFVAAHGGHVDATSEPGTPTTFSLILPKEPPSGTSAEPESMSS